MAVLVGAGQVKTTDGKIQSAQQGAWYDGQQYYNGSLSSPGQINSQSSQPGAGQQVSQEVMAQTNPNNPAYVKQQQQNPQQPGSGQPGNANSAQPVGANTPAVPDLQALRDQAYNTPEMVAANLALHEKQTEIEQKKQALVDREAQVSDDPWLTEGQRVGSISKLRDKANAEIQNLAAEYSNMQTSVSQLTSQADQKIQTATQQYSLNQQAYQDSVSANAVSTTQYDDGQNLYAVSIDKGGNVINKQLIGASKPIGSSAGSKTDQANADQNATVANAAKNAKEGRTLQELVDHYGIAGGLSIEQIYAIYNENSPRGMAKESLKQVQQGMYATNKGFKPETTKASSSNPLAN